MNDEKEVCTKLELVTVNNRRDRGVPVYHVFDSAIDSAAGGVDRISRGPIARDDDDGQSIFDVEARMTLRVSLTPKSYRCSCR